MGMGESNVGAYSDGVREQPTRFIGPRLLKRLEFSGLHFL